MKWLKRSAIVIVVLLLLLAAGAWWLLATRSGLDFALARAAALTDNALHVGQARGRLVGPLDLADIRYDDGKGTRIGINRMHLELRSWPLLSRRAHVRDLQLDGIAVSLPENPPPRENPVQFSLEPSLQLWVDHAQARGIRVTRGKDVLFAADHIDLRGKWTRAGLELKQLDVHATDGYVSVDGTLAQDAGYRADTRASFAWRLGTTWYAGALVAHSDGTRARLAFNLSRPMPVALHMDMAQTGDHAWSGTLHAPPFDPRPLLGDGALDRLGITVKGSGDRHHATLTGRVDLNDYALLLQPLRARFDDDFRRLTIDQLVLGSPQVKGQLEASGVVNFAGPAPAGKLAVQWRDVQLPEALAGQTLDSHGSLALEGGTQRYHAQGEVAIGPPGKLAALTLKLDGSPGRIDLHTLALKQAQGDLQASGTLTLQPALAWQAQASATRLDPGQLFAGWSGALDFDIASTGTLPAHGPDVTLDLRRLSGRLRARAVSGSGKLHLTPSEVLDGTLALASGRSTLRIDGKPGVSNDVTVELAVTSLGDWLPDASGRLDGQFIVRGKAPALSVNGQLRGNALAWREQRADALHLLAGIPDISKIAGKLDLRATGVHTQGLSFQELSLLGEGSQRDHQLSLTARGRQLSGTLRVRGAMRGDSNWDGTLSTLDLAPQGLPPWRLLQPAPLRYASGAMRLGELCLTAGEPQLCVAASRDKAGVLDASYRLQALPLALVLNATGQADLPLRADGTLAGSGKLRRSAAGAWSGSAALTSPAGSITWTDRADAPLLRYAALSATADLTPARQRIEVHSDLDTNGRLDGHITLTGAERALAGQLDLRLNQLGFVQLLSHDVANVNGRLAGSFRFAGTLAQPLVTGQANLADFAAELPSAGLKLTQGTLSASTSDGRVFRVAGSVQSGAGRLAVDGGIGLGSAGRTALTLKGSQFTAVDIPAARVVVSPDLVVRQDAAGLDIGGRLAIDSAEVNLNRLPGSGATKASADVVVVDQAEHEQAARKLPISARIVVDLGRRTHVLGMGLDGHLGGQLTVIERPGRATIGQGQVAVDGTYRAYGQNLVIQRGQLLFASTPLDNPGLNIRAARNLDPNATVNEGQEVGLLISGTARAPVLTVFSSPLMEQSDALSYLVTGKPLSQVTGGEGDTVGAAAQALGSAAGNLLARSVGTRLGIDDIGVTGSDALDGNSAFTVGKYLSPRLYLSYGVGLFVPGTVITLRYRLTQRWNFEAQNATDFSRASLNYRIEK